MRCVSLGYFCSVAMELEKYGLRSESSPFDWLISDFEGVILAIKNNFEGYTEYEDFVQNNLNRAHYMNTRYNYFSFHDFDKYKPLKKQIDKVREKYQRRAKRFLELIKEPTIFVRYISDEKTVNGVSKELIFIEENYDDIMMLIKSFNVQNDIIFIANNGVKSDKIRIFNVEKDQNDTVAREPFAKNKELYVYIDSIELAEKQANIERYIRKQEKKKDTLKNKLERKMKKVFLREYVHDKTYN